jgi:hypothetical protein
MRSIIFILFTALYSACCASPLDTIPLHKETGRTANIIWFVPSKASRINGITIGLIGAPIYDPSPEKVTLNGVYADLGFVGAFLVPYLIGASIHSIHNHDSISSFGTIGYGRNHFREADSISLFMNGLGISGVMLAEMRSNGIAISVTYNNAITANGITITGIMNDLYEFRGIAIGGVRNKSAKGKGVQIGLFNNCNELKGIQIGLWNRTKKRSLPIINWGT